VTALARPRSNCTVIYRSVLSSERALQNNKHAAVWRKFRGEKKLVTGPRWVPDTKTDGRLTVGRKLTSTSTSTFSLYDLTNSIFGIQSRNLCSLCSTKLSSSSLVLILQVPSISSVSPYIFLSSLINLCTVFPFNSQASQGCITVGLIAHQYILCFGLSDRNTHWNIEALLYAFILSLTSSIIIIIMVIIYCKISSATRSASELYQPSDCR
jgi:hypothetical protein